MRKEIDNSDFNDFQDAAVRHFRLIRIGIRNKDQKTLDVVKGDLQSRYGDTVGAKVFDNLLFREAAKINKRQIEKDYPELKGKI